MRKQDGGYDFLPLSGAEAVPEHPVRVPVRHGRRDHERKGTGPDPGGAARPTRAYPSVFSAPKTRCPWAPTCCARARRRRRRRATLSSLASWPAAADRRPCGSIDAYTRRHDGPQPALQPAADAPHAAQRDGPLRRRRPGGRDQAARHGHAPEAAAGRRDRVRGAGPGLRAGGAGARCIADGQDPGPVPLDLRQGLSAHPQGQGLCSRTKVRKLKMPLRLEEEALRYCRRRPKAFLVPFGMRFPAFIDLMATALQWAIPKQVREHDVRRMWLVVGSATVLTALYKVFPKAHFNAVQVGRTVWPDMIDPDRATIHVAPRASAATPSTPRPTTPSPTTTLRSGSSCGSKRVAAHPGRTCGTWPETSDTGEIF